MCHLYNLARDDWREAGALPQFHLVTQQISCFYQGQTLTIFTLVDFSKNRFTINCARNSGDIESPEQANQEWTWIHKEVTDIDNFCMKAATICQNRLLVFCRGRPRNVIEQCCSFLLILKLKIEKGMITGLDGDYHYFKLDPLVNPEFLCSSRVSYRNNDLVVRTIQEANYSDSFPFVLSEVIIPDQDMSCDMDFSENYNLKLIDIEIEDNILTS
mmetsp:Transcript_7829/g.13126  ORF Transcript_7829/g.13126 Transcript_7829/m.13126 type:complete len:215 (-) Transcript_7829:26-670(-)